MDDVKIVDIFNSTDTDEFKKECLDFIQAYYSSLRQLFNISMSDVAQYLRESKYGGYPEEPGGSVWRSEGKFIYVLIRHMKPKAILEIGNYKGRGSTNHILQAIDDNKYGEATLVDIEERLEFERLHSRNFNRVINDSLKFLEQPLNYDLIIQDGNHEYEHVKKELELMAANTQQSFWLWGHDYFTIRPPQCEIARSWESAGHLYEKRTPLKDAVSNCGFILAQYVKK